MKINPLQLSGNDGFYEITPIQGLHGGLYQAFSMLIQDP